MGDPRATASARAKSSDLPPDEIIFGQSPAMRELLQRLRCVAASTVPVLLYGESGSGKDVVARLLHEWSAVAAGPFVRVNCPAIPGQLLESELFGYEKGAFTGAITEKPGRFEQAQDGTIFLDEISEMDVSLQAKLLHALQDGTVSRIGSQQDIRVQTRVVCATNRNLEEEVELGRFRRDLLYRIAVVSLRLPSLRERREDIPEIARYMLARFSKMYNTPERPLTDEVLDKLLTHSWPGNMRELENVTKRYAVFGTAVSLTAGLEKSPRMINADDFIVDGDYHLKRATKRAISQVERHLILRALQAHNWNRTKAAKQLCISYRALLYKIQEAGLPSTRSRGSRTPKEQIQTDDNQVS
jgi:two-component system response regulator AtoC